MLKYNILASKPLIRIPSDVDGTTDVVCKDLLSNTINPDTSVGDFRLLMVSKEYVARPDLISLAVFGSDEYADILCKLNGISNPFELNEGMILMIPAFSNVTTIFKHSVKSELAKDSNTIGKVSKTNQKPKNVTRNPSEQIIGDSTFIIDKKNKIVYY